LIDTLSAPVEAASGLVDAADAACDAEGDVQQSRDVADPTVVQRPAFGAGGDVIEDQFVGALIAIARGQFGGIAHVGVADELHALHHPAVLHVQAGDDPPGRHSVPVLLRDPTVMPPPIWLQPG
jgi:hypothetical protein